MLSAQVVGNARIAGAQVTIGPVIDNGFYYDFAYERPFTPEDLAAIEARVKTMPGVDQVILITQTETIPHERALSSIEMFGRHVIPELKKRKRRAPAATGNTARTCRS